MLIANMPNVTLIGFGEAGRSFALAPGWQGVAATYDVLTNSDATRMAHQARCREAGVIGSTTLAEAVIFATTILCVVTADQALAAAQDVAQHIVAGALYFDMNSVAPDTKRAAARAVDAAGGRYVDVAVMAPVEPARMAVPLLLSGPHAADGADVLRQLGFSNIRILAGEVGRASSVKMMRSIMVKGIEALTAEMLLGAKAAGVTQEVLASLGDDWGAKADYSLDRMLIHGTRRAAEMREVATTLIALGVEPVMTLGTIRRQAEIGAMGPISPDAAPADLIATSLKSAA